MPASPSQSLGPLWTAGRMRAVKSSCQLFFAPPCVTFPFFFSVCEPDPFFLHFFSSSRASTAESVFKHPTSLEGSVCAQPVDMAFQQLTFQRGSMRAANTRATTRMHAAKADVDFAIVGAGPAGLAAALGLKRCFPDASIQVRASPSTFTAANGQMPSAGRAIVWGSNA